MAAGASVLTGLRATTRTGSAWQRFARLLGDVPVARHQGQDRVAAAQGRGSPGTGA